MYRINKLNRAVKKKKKNKMMILLSLKSRIWKMQARAGRKCIHI